MSLNETDYIKNIAEDVKENPDLSLNLVKRFLPLAIVLVMAWLLWLYFTNSEHSSKPSHTKKGQEVMLKADSAVIETENSK